MEEKFIVSARKYRPLTFDSVVGQKAVTNTLLNAIKNNQLAQAFLFCGPRGVGKTTCARILAKAVNAQDPENLDVELDSFNVFELDAASNNSVDDVRKLVEQVRIAPAGDVKYKVYIIDEVHMLSTSAFNAFLKTLEEPPAYAIFVLATTEKHKIIPTILSRCQVFDFSRISTKDIANHLASIAEKEGVKADIDALMLIAQKADGGLRDALSIFDQMVAFTGKELTHSSVAENLNVLDIDTYFGITNCVLNQDIPSILNAFNDIINKGFDPHLFIVGLGDHFRNLLLAQEPKLTHVLDLGENLIQRYTEEGPKFKRDELIEALDLCSKTDNQYKQSKNQHLLVELCLMQLCSLQEKKKSGRLILPPPNKPVAKVVSEKKTSPEVDVKEAHEINVPAPEKPKAAKANKATKSTIGLGLSLKAMLTDEEETSIKEASQVEATYEGISTNDFTKEALEKAWEEYTTIVKQEGNNSYATTLKLTKPEYNTDKPETITCLVLNSLQLKQFNEQKQGLLNYLRKTLNNKNIQVDAYEAESNDKRLLYTDGEKLRALAESNPNIKLLIDKLGLETEF